MTFIQFFICGVILVVVLLGFIVLCYISK